MIANGVACLPVELNMTEKKLKNSYWRKVYDIANGVCT